MINKIKLKNIQSHEDTVFEFVPGVNMIVGETGEGKSAAIRGLDWAIWNNSMGPELVSHWAKNNNGNQNKDISVLIEKGNRELCRIREPRTNSYTLTGIQDPFTAISSDVPEQVQSFLNMTDVNFHLQDDYPFLLYETPGNAARIFNKVVKLDIIDRALSGIKSKKMANSKDISIVVSQIESTEKSLEKYCRLPDFEKVLIKYEAEQYKLDSVKATVFAISELLDGIERLKKELEDLHPEKMVWIEARIADREFAEKALSATSTEIKEIADIIGRIESDKKLLAGSDDIKKIEGLIHQLQVARNKKQELVDEITNINLLVNAYDADNVLISQSRKISAIEMLLQRWDEVKKSQDKRIEDRRSLQSIIALIENDEKIICEYTVEVQDIEKDLPEFCPTCGKPLLEDICNS